jgi:hypothetical protein
MQGIYTYIPEINHVPKKYSVATILSLLFMTPMSLVPALTNVLLHQHFPKHVCSAQYGSFLLFLYSMVSWYGAHVFSE